MIQHEYAFDVKLFAVIRVLADSKKNAIKILDELFDAASLNVTLKDHEAALKITEASLHVDDVEYPYLFEIDGKSLDELDEDS